MNQLLVWLTGGNRQRGAPIGEQVEIPANYIDHVEEGTDPGQVPVQ